jgi:hypothetical protein
MTRSKVQECKRESDRTESQTYPLNYSTFFHRDLCVVIADVLTALDRNETRFGTATIRLPAVSHKRLLQRRLLGRLSC